MPNLPSRDQHEAAIVRRLAPVFRRLRKQIESGRSVDMRAFADEVSAAIAGPLGAVYDDAVSGMGIVHEAIPPWTLSGKTFLFDDVVAKILDPIRRSIAGVGRAIRDVLSPAAVATIAATYVTVAIVRGELDARISRQTGNAPPRAGLAIEDGFVAIWRIFRRDERLCPVCSALNGKPQKHWIRRFPNGPPAHPNCRCGLDYVPRTDQ